MRLVVNAASAHMGGAFTYIKNVVRWLPEVAPESECVVVVPSTTREKLAAYAVAPHVQLQAYPYAHTGGLQRFYFDQVGVPRLLRKHRADVLFSSTGFGSWFAPQPELLLVRNPVYFNRDFHAKYRELGRSLGRTTLRRWHSVRSIQAAEAVLFPTQAMQAMVEPYADLAPKQTAAIHYGFDRERFFEAGTDVPPIVPRLQRWKEAGELILLSVSTYAVHKNFEVLIEALPHLRAAGLPFRLVTTTSRERTKDKAEYDALQRRAAELGVDDLWVESGYVAYDQLQWLYGAADAYVFPSFTESFGHSLVEAMACGLPVIAADMPVNREVCGEAGQYFATFDPAACARVLRRILQDETERRRLAQQATERAMAFSWQGYTQQLVELLRSLLTRGALPAVQAS